MDIGIDNDELIVLVVFIYVYIICYNQLEWPRHQYVAPVEYASFEFSLNAWDDERQRWMMR